MALSDHHRTRLERLPTLLEPLLPLTSLANPAVAAVTYVYGVVMRILELGTEVREAVAAAGGVFDEEVRTAGLFRVPIEVNVQPLQLQSFVELGRRRYPRALEQLEDDVRALDDPGHPDRRGARERLAIARSVIPRVYDHYERTGELRHREFPLLSLEHLQLLNPGEASAYRALVANLHIERATLFDDDRTSPDLLSERLPAYVQAQLRVERHGLEIAQQQALNEAIASVRELYWNLVFGEGDRSGVVEEAVEFIVERAVDRIETERAELEAEREQLAARPAEERDDHRLAAIAARHEALGDLGRRLQEGRT